MFFRKENRRFFRRRPDARVSKRASENIEYRRCSSALPHGCIRDFFAFGGGCVAAAPRQTSVSSRKIYGIYLLSGESFAPAIRFLSITTSRNTYRTVVFCYWKLELRSHPLSFPIQTIRFSPVYRKALKVYVTRRSAHKDISEISLRNETILLPRRTDVHF